MKFVCDNCGTQYLISDEKIGPRGAKIRCKRCGNIIVIRPPQSADATGEDAGPDEETFHDGVPLGMGEPSEDRDELGEAFDQLLKGVLDPGEDEREDDEEGPATQIFSMEEIERLRSHKDERDKIDEVFSQAEGTDIQPPRPAAKEEDREDREEWYVAIKDEQMGPMGLPELENRWDSGEIDPGTLAWHPGMDEWIPVQDVPKLRYLLGSMESREIPESVENGAASPVPGEDEHWAPSSGSSLTSLVETELEAVKDTQPPPEEIGVEAEMPEEPEEGALEPWEKEEPISGEVARPSESFFDSSLDQSVTDSGGAVVRAGRGMARPAYLSEGSKGGLNNKLILVGSISLVVLIVIGVVVFKLLQEPPREEVEKTAPVDQKVARAGNKAKAPDQDAKLEKKDAEKPAQDAKKQPEAKDEKKQDEIVVGKAKKEALKTPSAKSNKGSSKKKNKKTAKAGSAKKRPPRGRKTVKPPPSDGGLPATLSKAQIGTTMKKYIRAMKGCVKQQQQRDPSVTGTMLVSFAINGTGKVSEIKILSKQHKGTYVAGCITYIIKSMKFPKFSGDPITIPRVPLRLGG
jgi:predicted Zn finger-like uncharacterized protein